MPVTRPGTALDSSCSAVLLSVLKLPEVLGKLAGQHRGACCKQSMFLAWLSGIMLHRLVPGVVLSTAVKHLGSRQYCMGDRCSTLWRLKPLCRQAPCQHHLNDGCVEYSSSQPQHWAHRHVVDVSYVDVFHVGSSQGS